MNRFQYRGGSDSVKAAAVSVQGYRPEMEDKHTIAFDVHETHKNVMIFGVYDGHGGHSASDFLQHHIVPAIRALENPFDEDQIKRALLELDQKFLGTNCPEPGSTACFAIAKRCEGSNNVHFKIVNVGDSRAMVVRPDGSWEALSFDHKPHTEIEAARIQNAHGFVRNQRVDGNLAVSRAFGDAQYKSRTGSPEEHKVIAVPDFKDYVARPGETILICCDGVFECASWRRVAEFLQTRVYGFEPATPRVASGLLSRGDDMPEGEEEDNEDEQTEDRERPGAPADAMDRALSLDPAEVAWDLIKASIDTGSRDNHTAIVVIVGDGSDYLNHYPAEEWIPGPYHKDAGNPTFQRAYVADLEMNGYSLEEQMDKIIQFEQANGLPTSIPTSTQPAAAASFDQAIIRHMLELAHQQ